MNKLVKIFAKMVAYNKPFVPNLNVTINIMFKIIVNILKMKLDKEYIFIFPIPLDIELQRVIKIQEIIYSIKTNVNLNFSNDKTINKIIHHIIILIIEYIQALLITFILPFFVVSSIKNLNIDSSIKSVINGTKKRQAVTKKSYIPYSDVDKTDV